MNRTNLIGYIGLALVQLNVLPAIWQAFKTGHSAPLVSVALMVVGLACYLYNSVLTGNRLYTVGNAIGLFCNTALLAAIALK